MINVTLGEVKTQEEKPFPKLQKMTYPSGKWIVVFSKSESNRVVVYVCKENKNCYDNIGDFWGHAEKNGVGIFTDYNEPITLQNA